MKRVFEVIQQPETHYDLEAPQLPPIIGFYVVNMESHVGQASFGFVYVFGTSVDSRYVETRFRQGFRQPTHPAGHIEHRC